MQSYSSYYMRILSKVLKVLEASTEPLRPKQIFSRINMLTPLERENYSTLRVYLPQYVKNGDIDKPFYGYYSAIKVRDGVTVDSSVSVVRVHNVVLVYEDMLVSRHGEVAESVDGVVVKVTFGVQNRKVTCSLAYDVGMDWFLFKKCMDVVKKIVWNQIGVNIDGFEHTACVEFNEDHKQYRMDGVKCVSVRDFLGQMERIYNKGEGLRNEVKVQKTDLPTIYATLKGGTSFANFMQLNSAILQELREIKEALKYNNRLHVQSLNERNGVA